MLNFSKQNKLNMFVVAGIAATLLLAPPAAAAEIPGDIAEPYGKVDEADLMLMAGFWMTSICPKLDNCFGADISGPKGVPDGTVNLYDFSVLAAHWMEGT